MHIIFIGLAGVKLASAKSARAVITPGNNRQSMTHKKARTLRIRSIGLDCYPSPGWWNVVYFIDFRAPVNVAQSLEPLMVPRTTSKLITALWLPGQSAASAAAAEIKFAGVNLSCAEFGQDNLSGTDDTHYP
jgi:hypothetical protein